MDLLIRSYISEKFFLLNLLFHSIDQMWPKNIGDVVLVMDEGQDMALDLVPSWVKVGRRYTPPTSPIVSFLLWLSRTRLWPLTWCR